VPDTLGERLKGLATWSSKDPDAVSALAAAASCSARIAGSHPPHGGAHQGPQPGEKPPPRRASLPRAQRAVRNDIEFNVRHLDRRIALLEEQAVDVVGEHPGLRRDLLHLTSVRGIARTSAVQILAELGVLPADSSWISSSRDDRD
jgi:hypothetical protein